MSKKARSQAIQVRKRREEKDLSKAEKRRQLEQLNAAARRLKLIELLRTKAKGVQPRQATADRNLSCPCPDKIRREDVTIDAHTDSRKAPRLYRLEGDTGWV